MTFSSIISFCEFFFPPYPTPSCTCLCQVASYSPEFLNTCFPWIIDCSLLVTWPISPHIPTYTQVWKHFQAGSTYNKECVVFLWAWVTLLNTIFYKFTHFPTNNIIPFFFTFKWNTAVHMYHINTIHFCGDGHLARLVPLPCYYEPSSSKLGGTSICEVECI